MWLCGVLSRSHPVATCVSQIESSLLAMAAGQRPRADQNATVPRRLSAGDDGQDDRGRVPGVVVDNLVGDDGCVSTVQGLAGAGIGRTVRVVARRDLHPDAMATSEEVARRGQLNTVGVDHTWGNQRRGGN